MRKRIVLISNMYPSAEYPNFGIFVKNFEETLTNEGFVIKKKVITKKTGKIAKLISYLKVYFQIIPLYFTSKKDEIIYVHFPLYFAPILWSLSILNKNLVLNFHGSDAVIDTTIKKLLCLFMHPVVKQSKVVVPSTYYKSLISDMFNIKDTSILVYPSGGVSKKIFFSKEQINKGFTVGFVSNFIEEKGWKVFLEALKILKNEKPEIECKGLMVGSGPDSDKIVETIEKLNIDVLVEPPVLQNKLCGIYNNMDLFVFPTYRSAESLGLVGIEAMMCGVPVVASKVGGPMGYVKDGYNGFLFNIKDSNALANKILSYYNLAILEKRKIKENCISTAMKYDSETVKKDLVRFLNQY